VVNGQLRNERSDRIVTEEMILSVKWEYEQDAAIARQWHVSRERVRQIRQERALPICKVNVRDPESHKFLVWLLENRASVEGKAASIVANQAPFELNKNCKYRTMKKSGIPFLWSDLRKSPSLSMPINWDLPNAIIDAVWNRSFNWSSNCRTKYSKPKSFWVCHYQYPLTKCISDNKDGIVQIIHDEISKAIRVGITPRWDDLARYGISRNETNGEPVDNLKNG